MKKSREKDIIVHYIRERYKLLIAYGVIILLFMIFSVIYEYDNGIVNMSYAVIIILFIYFCAAIPDFICYRNKCNKLFAALDHREECDYLLPAPKGLAENLYYNIVCGVQKDKRGLVSELDEKKRDMADYYTMWIHQIKTPIAALRLLLLREGEETNGSRQAPEELFKIERYAEMALHYARLDSMSSDMLFKEHDISYIIRQAVKKYSILFIGSGLNFTMEEFECRAVTDEKWLVFAVEQILSNALKYTQQGGISIYGADEYGNRQGKQEESVQTRYVVIEDTGIGIRACDLPRIFERGFTGYNGRMGKKSTGIGLYMCRQILERLSHTVRADSHMGRGTKVILGFKQDK